MVDLSDALSLEIYTQSRSKARASHRSSMQSVAEILAFN